MILLLFARPVSDEDLFEAAEEIAFPRKLISTFTSSLTIYEMSTAENRCKFWEKNKQKSWHRCLSAKLN